MENLKALPLYADDYLFNTQLIKLNNFKYFNDELIIDSLEDSYESIKNANNLIASNYTNLIENNLITVSPISYTKVLDYFRGDFEDNSTSNDFLTNDTLLDTSLVSNDNSRVFNPIKLRSTARNSIVTFNAIQKVFKSRYDEGRSNARLQDLSNSYNSHLFLTAGKTPYERILGKNYESFFSVNLYNTSLTDNFSNFFSV